MATTDSRKALRKSKFERQVGRRIVNPLVGALDKMGIRASSTVELETIGAKSGETPSGAAHRPRRRQRRLGGLSAR